MKFRAALVLACSTLACAAGAQQPASADAFIDSRQSEVVQIGSMIYHVHFDDGSWMRQPEAVCPAFTNHVFARFSHKDSNNDTASYLAVYPLNAPAATTPDKPWRGGVVLVPLPSAKRPGGKIPAERESTIKLFNRVWADELAHSGSAQAYPRMTWTQLAACYARLSGEQAMVKEDPPSTHAIDLHGLPVKSVLVNLPAEPNHVRSLYVRFNAHGLIEGTDVTDEGFVRHISPPTIY
jgi:hypothetical protein